MRESIFWWALAMVSISASILLGTLLQRSASERREFVTSCAKSFSLPACEAFASEGIRKIERN